MLGAGVKPRTALADAAGIAVENGILVNQHLETSASGVFAAGDVARWPDRHSGERTRVEHWVVAERMGQVAALIIMGRLEHFDAVPFFWSWHYHDLNIDYLGYAPHWDNIAVEGKVEAKSALLQYRRGDRVLAVATVDRDLGNLKAEVAIPLRRSFGWAGYRRWRRARTVRSLARIDARVRHDPAVRVTVSGRTMGRAPGGMADTIRRRIRQQDEFTDGSLEPSMDAYRRFDFRRRVRAAWQLHSTARTPPVELAADLGIPAGVLACMLQGRFFGSAWADIQAASPFLVRRRVRFTDLPNQIAYARQLLKPNAYDEALCTAGSKSDPCNE